MTAVELAEFIQKQQRRLVRLYMRAYEQLLDRLQYQALAGLSEAHTISLLRDIEGILEQLNVDMTKWIEDTFPQVYRGGSDEAAEAIYRQYGEFLSRGTQPLKLNMAFGAVHQQAVERLAFDTFTDLAAATKNVSDRLKKSIRLAAERVFPTGVISGETRIQMTKKLVEALGKEGFTYYLDERGRRIKLADYKDAIGPAGRRLDFAAGGFQSTFLEENWVGFVDIVGRRWDLFNYAEMLTRTKVAEAESRGTEDRLVANGLDLVQITSHGAEDWCSFYEGKVFSISGKHPVYPPLAQAPNGGTPFHPRCRHREAPFIEKFHTPEELEAAKIDPALLGKNLKDGRADQAALNRIMREKYPPLTSEEKERLEYYTSDGEKIWKLNAALRCDPQSDLYRKAREEAEPINNALLRLPTYRGLSHRALTFGDQAAFDKFRAKHRRGRMVRYPGFTSTSLDPNIYGGSKDIPAGKIRVMLRINGQSGRNVQPYSPLNEGEREILFPLDSAFTVKSFLVHDWGFEVFLEEAVL